MQRIRMTVRREAGAILRVLSLVERRGFRLGAVSIGPLGPDLDGVELGVDDAGRDVAVLVRQLERLVEVESAELRPVDQPATRTESLTTPESSDRP